MENIVYDYRCGLCLKLVRQELLTFGHVHKLLFGDVATSPMPGLRGHRTAAPILSSLRTTSTGLGLGVFSCARKFFEKTFFMFEVLNIN